jgi:hypothetical protein
VKGNLVFPVDRYRNLADKLLTTPEESCAILLAGRAEHKGQVRLLVREIYQAKHDACIVLQPATGQFGFFFF